MQLFLLGILIGSITSMTITFFFIRKMKYAGDRVMLLKIRQLETRSSGLMKKVNLLFQRYARLYLILKKIRSEYVEALLVNKRLTNANRLLRDALVKENNKNLFDEVFIQ